MSSNRKTALKLQVLHGSIDQTRSAKFLNRLIRLSCYNKSLVSIEFTCNTYFVTPIL